MGQLLFAGAATFKLKAVFIAFDYTGKIVKIVVKVAFMYCFHTDNSSPLEIYDLKRDINM